MTTKPRQRLAAIVLNYRTPRLAVDCLESLVPELEPGRDLAVVVDNASGDGSADAIEADARARGWLEPDGPVRLVRVASNEGFAAGNNAGIGAVDADLYLLLNSDTLVRPGALAALRAAMEEPAVGLAAPRLEWPDGTPQGSCFRRRAPAGEFFRAARTGALERLLRVPAGTIPPGDAPVEPDWVSFACVLVRAEVFERIGLLDAGYFMYFEDADFCQRARAAGWRIRYRPEARIVHLRGGTSPQKALHAARKRLPRYWYASRWRYYRRFFGPSGPVRANLFWMLGRLVSGARELVLREPAQTCEAEWRDLWIRDPA